ncbi:class I SAM-dependent methyltransferase [Streptomyces macrosporus]|uniref:Class I SAM-dependent methyltransferase n=1 Tax=Streptomyces macrosporus TaxID=44032 RepID=A0ABP5X4A7_9ACTN
MTPTAAYDEIADRYEEDVPAARRLLPEPGDGDGDGPAPDALGRLLHDLLGEGSGVCLEFGLGAGFHTDAVRALGWTPVGVDVSAGTPRRARDRLPVVRADAGRLPLRSGSVPAVLAVATRAPDRPALLREAARVLRPGGVLVHVGAHPCSCRSAADRAVPGAVVPRPGRRTDRDARAEAGGAGTAHRPLPDLLHTFLDAGLTLERFAESGSPAPTVLAVGARRYP